MNMQNTYEDENTHYNHEELSMQDCIDNCLECFKVCEETMANFELISKFNSTHFKTLNSCAEICQTSAKMMIMSSPFHRLTCEACSTICKACADMCEALDDSRLSECIKACRKCAESCRAMASH